MLFTLGLCLLLTPFPSFQTPTNDKRDSIGNDGSKANAVLSLLKPITTVAPAKHTPRSALKPNTVNETVLPTTTQTPSVTSTLGTTKSKPSPLVIQTTPTAPIKAAPVTSGSNKDKPTASVNQTVSVKLSPAGESKATKDKPAPTRTPNVQQAAEKPTSTLSVKNTKESRQPAVTQSVSVNSPSTSETKNATVNVKPKKSRPQPSVNQTVSTSEDKPASSQPSVNHAVTTKSPSTNVTIAKDKPAPVQNVQTSSTKSGSGSSATTSKNKPTISVNQTATTKSTSSSSSGNVKSSKDKAPSTATVKSTTKAPTTTERSKASSSTNQTTLIKTSRPGPAPTQPIKVVIGDGCESGSKKNAEIELTPGAPLVMTHKISLVPGSCTGECEAKMTALEGRVASLEKEMSSLKEKWASLTVSCPNECSGNGECERGKCICHQGFMGPDCKTVTKDKAKVTMETTTTQNKNDSGARDARDEEQKTGPGAKETDSKTKVSDTAKVGTGKTQTKLWSSLGKNRTKNASNTTKTGITTVGQSLLQNKERKQEEARTGKPTVLDRKKTVKKPKFVNEDSTGKASPKSDQLKDEPHTNVTQTTTKKINGTAKIVTETSQTRSEKGATEHSTITEKTIQQKKEKGDVQSVVEKSTGDGKTGKSKESQKSQYIVTVTTAEGSAHTSIQQNKTVSDLGSSTKKSGGSGLGSVKIVNVSSYSFILTWSAPQGMFKNFTVIRQEPRMEGDEIKELEEEEATEIQGQREMTVSTTASSGKVTTSRVKAEARRVSVVVPGNTQSVEFSNLRANTQYVLQIYGTAAERRSRIHRVTTTTGPEPVTEVIFSNVTESSFAMSWNKPKAKFTGYRITYINIITGKSHSVNVDSEHPSLVLSKLSAGTSYIVTVTTTQGRVQSDAHTSFITTVPAPPIHLRAVNVTDTKAALKWTPSLGKVDRFVISYESSKSPNVTVTVMLSGNTVEHQLRGLQRGTLYTVKVLSQKDNLHSNTISTTFTTANAVKASEVGARYAVITWKHSTSYQSYRITYQVVGKERKEIILDSTVTEYKFTGLRPMSRYMVLVEGERNGHYTSLVTSEFVTGKLRFPFPTECSQELLNGALQSGEVDVYPQGRDGQVVRVYCDMETDGGGWTVFQRRMNGKTDFYRTWSEYNSGFGNISEEFWLGNKLLHNLTSIGPVSLRVDMKSGNDSAYAHYANFSIDSEERHYALTVYGYTGTAGDSMRYHNGRPFSARDKDPDPLGINCARAYMGGWWYKNCYKTNLNGLYGINSNNQGIIWIDWKGKDSSIPFTEMKFRPSRFSPATHG